MKKVEIDVRPVAWHDRDVSKYQATATLKKDGDAVCRIFGEPMATEYDAIVSLKDQCASYEYLGREGNWICNNNLRDLKNGVQG